VNLRVLRGEKRRKMETIELMLDSEQIKKLKELTVAAGEPEENWQTMAQILLNGAINDTNEEDVRQ
jgi:hypothetical protein